MIVTLIPKAGHLACKRFAQSFGGQLCCRVTSSGGEGDNTANARDLAEISTNSSCDSSRA